MIRVRDQSNELKLPKFTLDGFGQYQPDLPFAAPQPGRGATESEQMYPWVAKQSPSVWTKFPSRGMPSSPGETDTWAPLPAQGSAYAGKGVTMPDVPPSWDLGSLGAHPATEEDVNAIKATLLLRGSLGVVFTPLWMWFIWRALKHEKSTPFRMLGWSGMVGGGIGFVASAFLLAGGVALTSKKNREELKEKLNVAYKAKSGMDGTLGRASNAANPISNLLSNL